MPLSHRFKSFWRNIAHKRELDDDLDEEIRSYAGMLEDEKARTSTDRSTARREALLEVGGTEQIKESVRDVRTGATLDTIWVELKQSLRGLRRNPGLAFIGTVTLALGMGASIAVFSIVQAALLKPLPFRDADRVVQIWETRLERGIDQASFTEGNFWDVRNQSRSFTEVAAYHYDEANLTGSGPAEKVTAIHVSAGFFRTLGVSPVLGRDFSYEEVRAGSDDHAVLLGNRFWRERFGADPNILGKALRLADQAYTIIGVLPPGEPWLTDQLYIPFKYRADANRGSWEFDVIGRLAPGVSVKQAQADLQRIAGTLAQTYPQDDRGIGFKLEPSSTWIASDNTRRALWVLFGAVTFLLLIACLNIANLLLARGTARQREIAVRTALGASHGRLVRFVLMESLLLSGLGGTLGLALAYGAVRAMQSLDLRGIPRLTEAGLNPWVVGFAMLIAAATGVLSGLAPALQAPATGIAAALREGDRQAGSRGQGRLRAGLVTAEVAVSFTLLVGAGLLIRSFTELVNVNRGFRTERRLLFSVSLPASYWEKGKGKQFLDRFFEHLDAVPEVIAAGAVNSRPVEGGNPGMAIASASGSRISGQNAPPWAGWRIISPGYFRAIGLPLLRGRFFEESDRPVWGERGQPVPERRVILSERLANQIFPNEDPVGKHVALWKGQSDLDAEVIGVVGDSRERGLSSGPTFTVYLPYGANALPAEFVVHTRGNPASLAPTVRSIVASLDPDLPVADVRSFDEVVSRSVAPQRFEAVLLSVFSGLGLLLATVGIYGVLSYSTSRRTAEIGLRVALGASRSNILRMTVGQGMRPALLGIVMGGLAAWWISRYMATLLFGVKPFDAVTYWAVAVILSVTALAACYLPGRHAMHIDPAVALRVE
jgi:putative ABC transport system permease protein